MVFYIWGYTYKFYLNTLQLSQNKAMRAITKQRLSDRITPVYRRLQVLKINDLHKLETAKFVHQICTRFWINHFLHHSKNILLAQLSHTVTPLEHLNALIISYRIFLHLVFNVQ